MTLSVPQASQPNAGLSITVTSPLIFYNIQKKKTSRGMYDFNVYKIVNTVHNSS